VTTARRAGVWTLPLVVFRELRAEPERSLRACRRDDDRGGRRGGGDLTTGALKSAIEVSAFRIPPSYNSLVDQNAGLPGPGAVSLPGMSQLLP